VVVIYLVRLQTGLTLVAAGLWRAEGERALPNDREPGRWTPPRFSCCPGPLRYAAAWRHRGGVPASRMSTTSGLCPIQVRALIHPRGRQFLLPRVSHAVARCDSLIHVFVLIYHMQLSTTYYKDANKRKNS